MLDNSSFTTSNTKTNSFENTVSTLRINNRAASPPRQPIEIKRIVANENLSPFEIELKQICKLFEKLSVSQSKQFLSCLVETFDEKFLRNFHFILGSLNHQDFVFNFLKKKLKKNKLALNANHDGSKQKPVMKKTSKAAEIKDSARLPNITERSKNNSNNTPRKQSKKKSNLNKPLNIDKFVLSKNIHLIDSPWSFKNLTSNNAINTNTENLIFKLKRLFRKQYEISTSSQLNRKSSKLDPPSSYDTHASRNESALIMVSNENTSLNLLRSRNKTVTDLKSIYLKKLKNNYYDRKMWNTLVNSNKQMNVNNWYIEKSTRDYNTEFNILKHHDWTVSPFAETIYKFTGKMPSIQSKENNVSTEKRITSNTLTETKRIGTATKFSRLQQSIITENNEIRLKYLNSIMNYLPSIQKWSNLMKQNLVLLLIENDSKPILEFLRDLVNKKVRPVLATIDLLPDNVLLYIFSLLDVETLEKVELVCNRWNYLANTPELWVYKCKTLGENENLAQIEAFLVNELSNDEDIDWKSCFIELKEFVKRLKQNYLDKFTQNPRSANNDNLKSILLSGSKRETSFVRSTRNNSAASYINFYQDDSNKNETNVKDLFFDVDLSSSISDKLNGRKRSKFINNDSVNVDNEKFNEKEHLRFQRQNQNMEKKPIESKYFTTGDEFRGDFNEVVIKTELNPTKDLLNKVIPSYKLRWKLEDEELKSNETVVGVLRPISKVLSLNNHSAAITCIDYDKKRIVTGGLDRLIFVYDFKEGKCLGRLEGHKGGIRCLQILKNRLCSGSFDQTIIIWNMFHFEKVISIGYSNHQDSISCLYFDLDFLICGSHDTKINVWKFNPDYIEKFEKQTLPFTETDILSFDKLIEHHKSAVMALTYDGINSIISANAEGLILVIDISGALLKTLSFTTDIEPITCVRLVGSLIVSTTVKGKLLFWNRKEESLESILKINNNAVSVNSIAFSGNRFYTAGADCLIKEWDLHSLTCLRQFRAHDGPILDLIAVEHKIISCGADRAIIWDFNTPKPKEKEKPKTIIF